jgi:ribosomal protein L40E
MRCCLGRAEIDDRRGEDPNMGLREPPLAYPLWVHRMPNLIDHAMRCYLGRAEIVDRRGEDLNTRLGEPPPAYPVWCTECYPRQAIRSKSDRSCYAILSWKGRNCRHAWGGPNTGFREPPPAHPLWCTEFYPWQAIRSKYDRSCYAMLSWKG